MKNSPRPLLRIMRAWLVVNAALVFISGVQLYILSDQTAQFFAWPIKPPLTASFLGASYWASIPLLFYSSREKYWSHARLGVFGVWLFTALTTLVTLIHIDKFRMDSFFGWVWLVVYIVVPLSVPFVIIRQMREPGEDAPRERSLPAWMRSVITVQAAIMLVLGLPMLFAPAATGAAFWPWQVSALTGRAIAAWLLGIGFTGFHILWENDIYRARSAFIGLASLGAFQLIAVARYASALFPETNDPVLDWTGPQIWFYVLFLVSIIVVNRTGWLMADAK